MSELSIKSIFEKMENINVREDIAEAEQWLETKVLKIPSTSDEITNAIEKCNKGMNVFSALDTKMELLNKLADEVKNNSTLLCQLELKTRHILVKDSENKMIPLFIDYLKYYAQWSCMIYDKYPDYEPYGLCKIIFNLDTPLSIIGAVLGAALAAGNGLVCEIHSKMIPLATFLEEIFKNAGFPENTISFVEHSRTSVNLLSAYEKVTVVGDFNDVYSHIHMEKISISTSTLILAKTSAIIFENADLDSACDKLIDCVWSCKGMFPFGIDQLFVQENIFDEFVDKIKSKILKLNVANQEDCDQNKTSDILISTPGNYKQEIEIINKLPLQIGYKTYGENSESKDGSSDILSILAFRTAAEAINLANNNNIRLGVSIWSENISLCNEVSGKIKASILWINTHGTISPNAAFSPFNECGSYFGGTEGLLEYMKPKSGLKPEKKFECQYDEPFNKNGIQTCVESAKEAFETWCKYSPTVRSQCLLKLAELSSTLKEKFPIYDFNEFWVKPLQYWSVICNNTENITQLQGNIELKIFKEPVGVILNDIDKVEDFETIFVSLAYGNAVIITNSCPELNHFFEDLIKIIPKTGMPTRLLSVIFKPDNDIMNDLQSRKEIQRDFNIHQKFHTRERFVKAVTYNKCIWTTFGETLL